MPDKLFKNRNDAAKLLKQLSNEFVIIKNPSYIHPEYEISPLAPKLLNPAKQMIAVVMDMDGTTTTTEEICIHSLEYMVRKISGRMDKVVWTGLDHANDYPHIIGNSTTKHVEYLINTYKKFINVSELKNAFIYAALWTLIIGKDEGRKRDVTEDIINLGGKGILSEARYISLIGKANSEKEFLKFAKFCKDKYLKQLTFKSNGDIVRAAIDIYYQRYHDILSGITCGNSAKLAEEILGDKTKHLIEPLPGVGIFLALVKGLLGEDIVKLSDLLIKQFYLKNPASDLKFNFNSIQKKLLKLSLEFERSPLKVAVVTSSIEYEANIVLSEVFKVLKDDAKKWSITAARKKKIMNLFSDYKNTYDGFVTASDSNEIRLKPHRDLYSIALHKLSVSKTDFDKVVGFEDSESGTISIRAAGIGRCVAVPFAHTSGHNLNAAAFIAEGGLPEILLKHNLFIK